MGLGDRFCISMPNFIKIDQTVNLTVFKMAAIRNFGFWKFQFITVWTVKRPILHNLAKFREDRSIRCCDIAILVIFKMAATAILDFQNFEISTFCPL